MICLFARAYGVEQLCGVCRAVNYGNVYVRAVHVYGGLLYALKPAHVRVFKPRHILPRQHVHNRAQRRLHNAARHAEYYRRARGFAQHIVELLLRQVHKVQPRLAYHAGKLPRGKVRVHVAIAVPPELRPRYFKFLSRAGHYAHNVNVARVKVVLPCKIRLCHRALHLVGTLAGGKIGYKVRIERFAVFYPARAAACYHGQHAAVLYPVQQLRAFFHYGKIRREVHVEYLIRTQAAYGGDHLARAARAYGHAEFLANRHANSGSGLEHNVFIGVVKRGPYFLCGVLFCKRARGAGGYALAAVDAGHVVKAFAEFGAYLRLKAAVLHAYGKHALCFGAGGHTAAAQYAFVVIPYYARA